MTASFRHPGRTLLVSAALAALALAGLPRLHKVVSFDDQLDPFFASSRDVTRLRELYPDDPNLFLWFRARNREEACDARRFLEGLGERYPEIRSYSSPFDLRRADSTPGRLVYPKVLAEVCEGIGNFSLLEGSAWDGLLTKSPSWDFVAELTVARPAEAGEWGRVPVEFLADLRRDLDARPDVLWFGDLPRDHHMKAAVERDQLLYVLLAVFVMLGCRFFFGTWKSGAIYLVTLGVSGGIVLGCMGWMGHPLDALGISLVLLLALASIEDFSFVSAWQARRPEAPKRGFVVLSAPSFFTSLTTVIGFGSLGVSDLAIDARFGFWSAVGALLEWAMVMIVLPSFLRHFRLSLNWVDPARAVGLRWAERLGAWTPSRRSARLSMVVIPAALLGVATLAPEQDPARIFGPGHPLRVARDELSKERGWTAVESLVFEPGVSAEEEKSVLSEVARDARVARVLGESEALEWVLHGEEDPARRALIEREFSVSKPSERFRAKTGQRRALLYLRSSDTRELEQLLRKVEALCPQRQCFLAGPLTAFADFSQSFLKTLLESLAVSFALVLALALGLAHSLGAKGALKALLPSMLWGPAALTAFIAVSGVEINSVTCVVMSITIGLAGDNAIQYLFFSGKGGLKKGVERWAGASFATTALMSLAGLSLLFSIFHPSRELGWLLEVGFVSMALGEVWMLKAFLKEG